MRIDFNLLFCALVSVAALALVVYDGSQFRCELTNSHDVCFQQLNR